MVASPASRSCSGQSSGRANREGVPCHTGAATGSIVTVEGARFLVEPPGLGVPGDDGEREGPVTEAASSPPCAWGLRKPWRSALRASEVRIGAPLGPCHAMAAAKALAPSPEAGRFHGGGSPPPSTERSRTPHFDHRRHQREGGGRTGARSGCIDSSPRASPAPSGSSGRWVRSMEPLSPLPCRGHCVPPWPHCSAVDGTV